MNALGLVHSVIKNRLRPGDICIDATLGRGNDAAFLAEIVGDGCVTGFDIQREAIESSRALLDRKGLDARLILDSHANMDRYFQKESVNLIMFNLGYLPGGDHSVYTHFESTREAIEKGLDLLKKGGLMCVSVYYGGDSGYEERDALLPYLKGLDDGKYQVVEAAFYNWKNDPPIPFFIVKL